MNLQPYRLFNYKVGLVRYFNSSFCRCQKSNHYDSLGITPKATQGDIKSAYYKLSKQYHPDLNKNSISAADKFRDIAEAYEVLGNLKSRKLYDRELLVRGSHADVGYTPEEDIVEKYSHAPFYHHRNKPTSRKTSTNKTTAYNIDEWTRAHYSETFSKSFSKKYEEESFHKERLHTKQDNIASVQIFSMLLLFISIGLAFGSNPGSNFDSHSQKLEPDKKLD